MSFFDDLLGGVFSLIEDSAGRLSNDKSLSSSQRSEFASRASQAKAARKTIEAKQSKHDDE